jgi:hypothetical protein
MMARFLAPLADFLGALCGKVLMNSALECFYSQEF